MKIAVAANNSSKSSEISDRAGRAPYYLIFDNSEELSESVSNPYAVQGRGAGSGVARMLAEKGVDLVIAGAAGSNMKSALDERGMKFIETGGLVQDAIKSNLQ